MNSCSAALSLLAGIRERRPSDASEITPRGYIMVAVARSCFSVLSIREDLILGLILSVIESIWRKMYLMRLSLPVLLLALL